MHGNITRSAIMGASLVLATACDGELDRAEGRGFTIASHVKLTDLRAAPWMATLRPKLLAGEHLNACEDLVRTADSLTFGASQDRFEMYIQGPMDPEHAEACAEATYEKMGNDVHWQADAVQIGERLFGMATGSQPASVASLARLSAAAPTSDRPHSIWLTARGREDGGELGPIERFEAWADAGAGLDAHVSVKFRDTALAKKHAGEINSTLAAMVLVPDLGNMARNIKVRSDGQTLRADVHASAGQLANLGSQTSVSMGSGSAGPTTTGPGVRFEVRVQQ